MTTDLATAAAPRDGADAPATSPAPPASPRRRRRTLKRALIATALTLGLTAGGGYLWLDSASEVKVTGAAACTAVTPAGTGTGTGTGDRDAVCGVLSSLAAAWGAADADAYGALFTQDATYTTYVGTHYQGRGDITEAHRALFGGFVKGTKLADSILGIRFLGPDAAVVTSRGDTYTGGRPGELSKVQTYTLTREADGRWRIAAFQNTQRQPVMEKASFLLSPGTVPRAEK
ncbi:SgcJ/EcaC family oxidoreductase [Streptomyces sp. NBC_00572]|uniref:SgcJ/EcaC family oxidoreductase n=1 Tax=Streptomyces sp. NBC_00572 TaxID=2903664 RepID=UPI0022552B46|nr:SgcJ/EcaC family oxidoreductase [Streptomyces sp. NBC_00572]MCX4982213.1 SgcJ/EcaC family oxidoreductase [Streptomyces sp. NBC_00572]